MVLRFAAAGPALFPAVSFFVYCRPSSALGFVLRDATLLVSFLDVLGHPLLLVGVTRFVSTGHANLHAVLFLFEPANIPMVPMKRRAIGKVVKLCCRAPGAYTVCAAIASQRKVRMGHAETLDACPDLIRHSVPPADKATLMDPAGWNGLDQFLIRIPHGDSTPCLCAIFRATSTAALSSANSSMMLLPCPENAAGFMTWTMIGGGF
jgi:hypothetical protein